VTRFPKRISNDELEKQKKKKKNGTGKETGNRP